MCHTDVQHRIEKLINLFEVNIPSHFVKVNVGERPNYVCKLSLIFVIDLRLFLAVTKKSVVDRLKL